MQPCVQPLSKAHGQCGYSGCRKKDTSFSQAVFRRVICEPKKDKRYLSPSIISAGARSLRYLKLNLLGRIIDGPVGNNPKGDMAGAVKTILGFQ